MLTPSKFSAVKFECLIIYLFLGCMLWYIIFLLGLQCFLFLTCSRQNWRGNIVGSWNGPSHWWNCCSWKLGFINAGECINNPLFSIKIKKQHNFCSMIFITQFGMFLSCLRDCFILEVHIKCWVVCWSMVLSAFQDPFWLLLLSCILMKNGR